MPYILSTFITVFALLSQLSQETFFSDFVGKSQSIDRCFVHNLSIVCAITNLLYSYLFRQMLLSHKLVFVTSHNALVVYNCKLS